MRRGAVAYPCGDRFADCSRHTGTAVTIKQAATFWQPPRDRWTYQTTQLEGVTRFGYLLPFESLLPLKRSSRADF